MRFHKHYTIISHPFYHLHLLPCTPQETTINRNVVKNVDKWQSSFTYCDDEIFSILISSRKCKKMVGNLGKKHRNSSSICQPIRKFTFLQKIKTFSLTFELLLNENHQQVFKFPFLMKNTYLRARKCHLKRISYSLTLINIRHVLESICLKILFLHLLAYSTFIHVEIISSRHRAQFQTEISSFREHFEHHRW